MDLFTLLVQLVCGATGGNFAAKLFPRQDLGAGGNSLAGMIGGALGSSILSSLAGIGPAPITGPDIGHLLAQAAGGTAGGGALAMIVAILKNLVQRPSAR
jgi:uncharacterized membrane protein YeaQ/YmgE (transglycosylase-associated protein family)